MTITTRSKRVSAFGHAPTPSAVGPGSYAPEKTGTSFKEVHRPLFSGFAASEKRNLNENKTTSAITPGPGAYLDDADQCNPKTPSNVFATKVSSFVLPDLYRLEALTVFYLQTSRFAPSAPGSTIFRPSSIQDNPGPGSYLRSSTSPAAISSNQMQELDGRAVNKFAHLVKPSAPAIPKKNQSHGYMQVGSELQPQPPSGDIYSGIGQDTVGPAAYNSHHAIWNEKKNVAPSLKSTVKRDVWGENAPLTLIPGPGHYADATDESMSKGGGLRGCKKNGKHARQSAVFASKVPILPTPKPTSHFDSEKDMEINEKEARLRYQLERQKTNVLKAKLEAFGSTTGRVQLSSQMSAPFSNPSFTLTPGPGMYSDRAHTFRGQKKHRTPASRSMHREENMGFSSATERYCLSKSKKPAAPGPGAYKSETPRSMTQTVRSKLAVGRNGVFGTTSERHVWEHLERMEVDEFTPGPGAYEKPVETHAGHFPLAATSAAFKSNSSRFTKHGNPNASPHVHCVGDHVGPAVGQYEIPASLALGGLGSPTSGKAGFASPPTSARAPFLSTSERAVFDTREVRDLPGPGAYSVEEDGGVMKGSASSNAKPILTRFHEIRASIGNEERFRVKPTVPETVGPGAYSIPDTVGYKSFNVTMAAASKARVS